MTRYTILEPSVLECARTRTKAKTIISVDVILPESMDEREVDIIQAIVNGQAERYAELVDQYQKQALRLAFSLLGNAEDAKDASQEAFVKAYRSIGKFQQHSKFSTWLYRIVVNECSNFYRRRARRPAIAGSVTIGDGEGDETTLFIEPDDPSASPRDQLATRELSIKISQTISGLPMKQRTAFVLHHLQDLPLEDVAVVMRCRLGTVKSHVFRATEHLRKELSPWLDKGGSSE